MGRAKVIMEYVEKGEGENRYRDNTWVPGTVVDASYLQSDCLNMRGNPLFEALPLPRMESWDCIRAYTRGINGYSQDAAPKGKLQKLMEIWALRNVRFPLSFHPLLEAAFYQAFNEAYEKRVVVEYPNGAARVVVNGLEHAQGGAAIQKKGDAVIGFSLIGLSGSGKSSAIEILTDHYPQAIRHHLADGASFVQLTYINVECHAYGNMGAIYTGIGHAIDLALGNLDSCYEDEFCRGRKSLGEKEQTLRRLIEHFGVGVIILEEIQNMNFDTLSDKSFENFLTLCNDTSVALVVVGTEDAMERMYPVLRTARRVGIPISTNLGDDPKLQMAFVKQLFSYQWFSEPVTPTLAMAERLIHYSHGVVGIMVRIYMSLCIDYERAREKPKVDEKYLELIVARYFSRVESLLSEAKRNEDEILRAIREVERKQEEILGEQQRKAMAEEVTNNSDTISQIAQLKGFLIGKTMQFTDAFTEEYLERIIDDELEKGTFEGKTQEESLRLFGNRLMELNRKPKKKAEPKMTVDEMRAELEKTAAHDPLTD